MLDLSIVLVYFVVIFIAALSGRAKEEVTIDEYFLSNRNLKWYSVALSTIATNIHGYQFLGMMGSAYAFGLAQASLEINAIQGIFLAAFVFVPLYLKHKVITITQFIKIRLGERLALFYTCANILLFSTVTLGAALFWGAFAADWVFEEQLNFIHENQAIRMSILILGLGIFSATYTYLGGLAAVVKTDIIQFLILLTGGLIIMFVIVSELGGWSQLYIKTPEMMHLHLPRSHEKLPWPHIFGLFLLNINYWCTNQTVVQRSLAAKSLREAQKGLLFGGVMKYVMAAVIVIPGIALAGVLGEEGKLPDPDGAFPHIVSSFLQPGLKGIILCALFASLMSTIDSTFNSLATLFSIDIYKSYINKNATDKQVVNTGRKTILVALFTGVVVGWLFVILKLDNPQDAFTHTLNEIRNYFNSGFVVIICSAIFLVAPNKRIVLAGFLACIPLHLIFIYSFENMNYFVRAGWVMLTAFLFINLLSQNKRWRSLKELIQYDSKGTLQFGIGLLLSLVLLHVIFH